MIDEILFLNYYFFNLLILNNGKNFTFCLLIFKLINNFCKFVNWLKWILFELYFLYLLLVHFFEKPILQISQNTKQIWKIYGNFDNYFSQNEIPYQPIVSISYNWSQKYYLIISDILWKIVYRSTQRMHGTINACTCIYSFYNHKKEFLIVRRKE